MPGGWNDDDAGVAAAVLRRASWKPPGEEVLINALANIMFRGSPLLSNILKCSAGGAYGCASAFADAQLRPRRRSVGAKRPQAAM